MTEFILTMGYYPDRFVLHEMPPDVFFEHIVLSPGEDRIVELIDTAYDLVLACVEKYKLTYAPWNIHGFAVFNWADTFWSVSPKGDRSE